MTYKTALLLLAAVSLATAATTPIGVATANGNFSLDDKTVPANATIFDGSRLETSVNASRIALPGGTRFELGQSSRGVLHRDSVLLEKGTAQLDTARPFQVQALSFRIASAQERSSARISITGAESVRVAAVAGTIRVLTREGVLLASLAPGRALDFAPEAGAAAPSRMKGCLAKSGDRYWLKDETSNVTAELRGKDLGSRAGSKVVIVGKALAEGKTGAGDHQVIEVLKLDPVAETCGGDGGSGAPPPTAQTKILGMTKGKAVIAGVGIAGAVAIPAIVMTRDSNSSTLSPTSR